MEHIDKYIGEQGMKVAGPNAFIDGVPTEFDLLLVNSQGKPMPRTNAYDVADVRIAIEVKTSGMFGTNEDDVRKNPNKVFDDFKKPYQKTKNLKLAYLSIHEQGGGVRKGKDGKLGRKYIDITHEIFSELSKEITSVDAFILSNTRTPPDLCLDQWEKFIKFITTV